MAVPKAFSQRHSLMHKLFLAMPWKQMPLLRLSYRQLGWWTLAGSWALHGAEASLYPQAAPADADITAFRGCGPLPAAARQGFKHLEIVQVINWLGVGTQIQTHSFFSTAAHCCCCSWAMGYSKWQCNTPRVGGFFLLFFSPVFLVLLVGVFLCGRWCSHSKNTNISGVSHRSRLQMKPDVSW